MNKGSTYESNVTARDDISVTKHGLKISVEAENYEVFVVRMKTREDEFRQVFNAYTLKKLFPMGESMKRFLEIMEEAVQLSRMEDLDDLAAIHTLGEGWVAEETLAIAVYCTL